MALELIAQAPRSQQMILATLLVALVAGSGYYFILSPKKAEVEQLRTENASLRAKLEQNRVTAANLSRFREEAAALRRRLDAVKARLPNEKEMPQLFRQISSLAHRSGLVVSRFEPMKPEPQEFYDQVPILVIAATGYHQLGEFFARLARLPRIVNIADFTLLEAATAAEQQKFQRRRSRGQKAAEETLDTGLGSMSVELTMMAYFLKPDETIPTSTESQPMRRPQPTKPGAPKAPQRTKR